MNKKLLSLLVLPLIGMTACSGNSFKEVKYLQVGNSLYVTEKGVTENVSHVGTYKLTEASKTDIGAYLLNFPSSFNLYQVENVNPNRDQTPFDLPEELHFFISGVNVTLELDGTETKFRTYYDYYYNEGTREIKAVVHEDEPLLTGGSSSVKALRYNDYGGLPFKVEIDEDVTEFPTSKYSIKSVEHEFVSKTKERIYSIGSLNHVEVQYK